MSSLTKSERKLLVRLIELEQEVERLKADSHPPVDLMPHIIREVKRQIDIKPSNELKEK